MVSSSPPVQRAVAPAYLRRARLGVALMFLTNGALFAGLLPRYPEIKAGLGLSNAGFGLAVACFPTGAILAGLAAGVLVRRLRSSRVALAGTIFTGIGVFLAAIAPNVWLLGVGLFLAGAMDAVTDVAQNAHGLRVQRRYGRSILNSFHAVWSIGAVTGGLLGAAAVGLGLSRGFHLGLSAVIFSVVALVAYRMLLPGPEMSADEERALLATNAGTSTAGTDDGVSQTATLVTQAAQVRASRVQQVLHLPASMWRAGILAALVLVAIGSTLVEDAGSSWAALYLHDSLGTPRTVAAFGFVALVGAQFIGRLLGDRLVDRFGQRAVARAGGVLVALGMGAALAFPSVGGTILGFAAAGLGVATLVPAAMHGADELPGLRAGTGLTVVSWLMRLGFLLSPPIVGLVADATSLRVGLLVVPIAGIIVICVSGVLSKERVGADSR